MNLVLWGILVFLGVVIALTAQRSAKLRKELNQLKHDHYDTSTKLKRIQEELRESMQPLRLQVANVATGTKVSPELILQGRLYHDVGVLEAQEMVEQAHGQQGGTFVCVDVRTPKEHAIRRIPGSTLVPFEDLDRKFFEEIPKNAEKVLLYCATGERSRMACEFLSQKGYANLYNLREGLQGWLGSTEGEGPVTFIQIDGKSNSRAVS